MSDVTNDMLARLNESMKISKKLMDMDSKIDNIASKRRGNIDESLNDENVSVLPERKQMTQQQVQAPRQPINSKLPKEILESFSKVQIDEPQSLNDDMFSSARQSINENRIVEQTQPAQTQTTQAAVAAPIDYSMIKMIVEDCMRKYIGSYTKKLLQESKGQVQELDAMINTNSGFKFLTKSGDLYEAKLIKKGNIKDK